MCDQRVWEFSQQAKKTPVSAKAEIGGFPRVYIHRHCLPVTPATKKLQKNRGIFPKPVEILGVLCYHYYVSVWVREKYTLLRILAARTYKIYRIGVDKDDDAGDNSSCRAVPCRAVPCRAVPCRAVPCRAVRSVVSSRLFVNPFPHNFIENRETVILTDTGGLCL